MSIINISKKHLKTLFFVSFMLFMIISSLIELNFYLKMSIMAVLIPLGIIVAKNNFQLQLIKDKKNAYTRLGIGLFFILISIGLGIYQYYSVVN